MNLAPANRATLNALMRPTTQASKLGRVKKNPFSKTLNQSGKTKYKKLKAALTKFAGQKWTKQGKVANAIANLLTTKRDTPDTPEKLKLKMEKLSQATRQWKDDIQKELIECLAETIKDFSDDPPRKEIMDALKTMTNPSIPRLAKFAQNVHDAIINQVGEPPEPTNQIEAEDDQWLSSNTSGTVTNSPSPSSGPVYPPPQMYKQSPPQADPNAAKKTANQITLANIIKTLEDLYTNNPEKETTDIKEFIKTLLAQIDVIAPIILGEGKALNEKDSWGKIMELMSTSATSQRPDNATDGLRKLKKVTKLAIKQIAMKCTSAEDKDKKDMFNHLHNLLLGKASTLNTFKEISAAIQDYDPKDAEIENELKNAKTELDKQVANEAPQGA